MRKLFVIILLALIHPSYAHHPSGGTVISGFNGVEDNTLTFPLPVGLSLDGDFIFGFHDGLAGEVNWTLSPFVHLGFDKYHFHKYIGTPSNDLKFAEDKSNYEVSARTLWQVGLGSSIGTPTTSGISIFGGLLPSYGQSITIRKKVNDTKNIKNISFKIPLKIEEMASMSNGDKISYQKNVAINTNVGLGFLIFGPSWTNSMKKNTTINWKKLNDKKVAIEIERKIGAGTGVVLGSDFAGVDTSTSISTNKGLTLNFDFNIPQAHTAYIELLKQGNLKKAQSLITSGKEGVAAQVKYNSKVKSRGSSAKVQFPFLIGTSKSLSRSMQVGFSQELSHHDNRQVFSSSNIRSENSWGFLSRRKRRDIITSGNVVIQNHTHDDGQSEIHEKVGGNIKLSYSRKRVDEDRFKKEINKMLSRTGIRLLNNLIPPGKKLGYIEIELDILLSKKAIFTMLKNINNKSINFSDFKDAGTAIFKEELKKAPYCKNLLLKKKCQKKLTKSVHAAINKSWKILSKMSNTWETDKKHFTKKYSDLLKVSIKNRYIFQSIWQQFPQKYIRYQLSIKGENIHPVLRKM